MNARMLIVLAAVGCLGSAAFAGDIIDQDNLETESFGCGYAIISAQSIAQVFTVGESGTLSRIDVQLWRSPGATNDITLRILSTTGGMPDPHSSGTLATSTITTANLPVSSGIPDPSNVPLSTVDVSSAGISVSPGDEFGISLSRVGAGAPPWVLWGCSSGYTGGDSYRSSRGETWLVNTSTNGFRTWVATCPEDLDGSGDVGFGDILAILSAWGNKGGPEDLDGNGVVDFGDLLIVLAAWGPCE